MQEYTIARVIINASTYTIKFDINMCVHIYNAYISYMHKTYTLSFLHARNIFLINIYRPAITRFLIFYLLTRGTSRGSLENCSSVWSSDAMNDASNSVCSRWQYLSIFLAIPTFHSQPNEILPPFRDTLSKGSARIE